MKNENLLIEQALHGYVNGHHLLAFSNVFSDKSQRLMDILSDLSGPEVKEGFTEYITGYPLYEDKYYAIAKTWYAPEMKRPGCVWTHTLLIDFKDLNKIREHYDFGGLFIKPLNSYDESCYSNSINIPISSNNELKLSRHKLDFLIWKIFSTQNPLIFLAESSSDYVNEIFYLLVNLLFFMDENFSFCTGSLSFRRINKKPFDLQIVPISLSKTISRSIKEDIEIIEFIPEYKCPEWVGVIVQDLLYPSSKHFYHFIIVFGEKYFSRAYLKNFAELYGKSKISDRSSNIGEFCKNIKLIFPKSDSKEILSKTINLVIAGIWKDWFIYEDSSDLLLELSRIEDMDDILIDDMLFENFIENLLLNNKFSIEKLFRNLINIDVTYLGKNIIHIISEIIDPEQLLGVNDEDIAIDTWGTLLRANNNLALCPEIWRQKKSFQLKIINFIGDANISQSLRNDIIYVILNNGNIDLSSEIYKAFGDESIATVLTWCANNFGNEYKIKKWSKICANNPEEAIKWLSSIQVVDENLLLNIISSLDPSSYSVLKIGKDLWIELFNNFRVEKFKDSSKLQISLFFLPIILLSYKKLPYNFVKFVFYTVHMALAKELINFSEWGKIEKLLPAVEWYNSWDKCKRLRRAMKRKGYTFNDDFLCEILNYLKK